MSLAPIRALVLDLGNVLVFHDNALLFSRLGERAGLTPDEAAQRIGATAWEGANRGDLDAEGIWRSVCAALGTAIPLAEFTRIWSSHFTFNDSIFPVLERLADAMPLVLLSNTNWLHVAWLQPRIPVLRRFKELVYSCEVGMVKPEQRIYEEALRHTGMPAAEVAYFDDIPEYVDAARLSGMQGHVFTDTASFVRTLSLRLPELNLT